MEEPQPTPRPCSTPHSAPVVWLKTCPGPVEGYDPGLDSDPPREESPDAGTQLTEGPSLPLDDVAAHLRADPEALAEFVAGLAPEGTRGDGWTPFARKLFLQVLADTGRVGLALTYVGLSRQSANALRHRDPLFAAGWDAAALIARNPMADELAEKGLDGITETVSRNGEVVAERRRFDTRLSIAVLHRLDKRCDRAEEQGSAHLAVMRRWDEYLGHIGKGDDQAARAILDSTPHGQFGQLPESANPIPAANPPGFDPWESVWRLGTKGMPAGGRDHGLAEGTWMTTFPPPPGFAGYENCRWDGFAYYERECTAEEAALLDASEAAAEAEELAEMTAEAQAERDSFFARLRSQIGPTESHG